METSLNYKKGELVVVPFPFSDLSTSKKRPALVLANLRGDDIILGQITSNLNNSKYYISISNKDLQEGSLAHNSIIKTNKLFTADKSIILYSLGKLKQNKIKQVQNNLISIFSS